MRFPAEFEPVSCVQITWPNAQTDWADALPEVLRVYNDLLGALLDFCGLDRVIIVTPDPARVIKDAPRATDCRVKFVVAPINDTWARDHSPLSVLFDDGSLRLVDFQFNGWGLKFPADKDNLIGEAVYRQAFEEREACGFISRRRFVLEGGAIDTDGQGVLLAPTHCLLSPNRNGDISKAEYEACFREWLGIEKVLWVDHGALAGDDTDGHIDTLARFAPGNTILYVAPPADTAHPDYEELTLMRNELRGFTNKEGGAYKLVPLPCPALRLDEDGNPMPATYANFLVCNGAVLVPVYGDQADAEACRRVGECYPGRKIVPVDCQPLIRQHGSLHCATMQYPRRTA